MKLLSPLLLLCGYSLGGENGPEYVTPNAIGNPFLWEPFDSPDALDRWTLSDDGKYSGGKWEIESLQSEALAGDSGLVLKAKNNHHALVRKLDRKLEFDGNLAIQYEVAFQNGIECGGAYMKLLSDSDEELSSFHDKTPFTIMFGPDKCGADYKLHFIFRYKHPKTGEITERSPTNKIEISKLQKKFTDNKSHLYRLEVKTNNDFALSIDNEEYLSGNLLSDISPPIMPPREIPDVDDEKPQDWDERERIPDPDAVKPEDWDEDAPAQIKDLSESMPDGWLADEAEHIPDPDAVRPDDWDDDMDGEFEAPVIPNPACSAAPGCGPWEPKMIRNPEYKGKWKSPTMPNPDYRGKWAPRNVPNPDWFEDLEPWRMTPVNAIGFELWTLSDNIYFDNIFITDNNFHAIEIASQTFGLRKVKGEGIVNSIVGSTEGRPWLWAVYIFAVIIPVFLIIACCCWTGSSKKDDVGLRKKTDAAEPDDEHDSSGDEDENEDEDEGEDIEEKNEVPDLEEKHIGSGDAEVSDKGVENEEEATANVESEGKDGGEAGDAE